MYDFDPCHLKIISTLVISKLVPHLYVSLKMTAHDLVLYGSAVQLLLTTAFQSLLAVIVGRNCWQYFTAVRQNMMAL